MTSTEKPTRLVITRPFANKLRNDETAVSGFTPIPDGSTTEQKTFVNYQDGFPPAYSTPTSSGGKYVGRGDMNALGDLASRNQFLRMLGDIVTFDSAFCEKVGGYPKGAILKYVDGYNIYDVISLVDNNTVDFTSVGVDNTNWRKLNVAIADDSVISLGTFETGVIDTTGNITSIQINACSGVTPRAGMISSTMKTEEITVSSSASSGFLIDLSLKYKQPGASVFSSVTLYKNESAASAITDPIRLEAGTIFMIVLAVSGIKCDNMTITTKLI